MTATDHETVLALAAEGLEYREHNAERELGRERTVLERARASLGTVTLPRLAGRDEVKANPGQQFMVARCDSHNDAFREKCRWNGYGLESWTKLVRGVGYCVYAMAAS